jgi:hypothetical protein
MKNYAATIRAQMLLVLHVGSAYMAALPKHSQLNSETNICDKIPCFLGNQTWVTLTNHQLLHYTNQCKL